MILDLADGTSLTWVSVSRPLHAGIKSKLAAVPAWLPWGPGIRGQSSLAEPSLHILLRVLKCRTGCVGRDMRLPEHSVPSVVCGHVTVSVPRLYIPKPQQVLMFRGWEPGGPSAGVTRAPSGCCQLAGVSARVGVGDPRGSLDTAVGSGCRSRQRVGWMNTEVP